jgi:uncharacterized membrane protein
MPRIAIFGVLAELVLDKLPSTPSRLESRGILIRLLFAGAAGTAIAREDRHPITPSIAVVCIACLAAAKAGHDIREVAPKRLSPLVVAVGEDLMAIVLAALACCPPSAQQR